MHKFDIISRAEVTWGRIILRINKTQSICSYVSLREEMLKFILVLVFARRIEHDGLSLFEKQGVKRSEWRMFKKDV